MNLYNHPPNQQNNFSGNDRSTGNLNDTTNNQDYFQFNNVSPEMIKIGLNAGQDILSKQTDKWTSGASGFWSSLKFYFSVSNSYVFKKVTVVLYPISNKLWSRIPADEFEREGEPEMYSRKWALPRQDPNAPDLYIPLMAFITYVLLYGLGKGMRLEAASFSPDIIIQSIWRCLVLQLIETCLIKFAVNLLSVTLPFSDVFAYSGYKYVGLCINTLSRVLGGTANFVVALYTTGMLGYFVLKTMAAVVPPNTGGNGGSTTGPPRHLILLAIAGVQFSVMLILSWL